MMFRKLGTFRELSDAGLRRGPKEGVRSGRTLAVEQIRSECENFGTSADHCDCEETVLASALYRGHIPCSHQFSFGVSGPTLSDEIRIATALGFPISILKLISDGIIAMRKSTQ
jgi:hypothetical protein